MWVLGVQSPLPKNMEWHSPDVEAAIAQSQEVLDPPGVRIGVSAGGIFRAMFALPTLFKVQKLPDNETLQDVLPPDLYLRWSQLKPGCPESPICSMQCPSSRLVSPEWWGRLWRTTPSAAASSLTAITSIPPR
jgi:hypothetical protein